MYKKHNELVVVFRYSEKNKSPDFVAIASRGSVVYLSVIQWIIQLLFSG